VFFSFFSNFEIPIQIIIKIHNNQTKIINKKNNKHFNEKFIKINVTNKLNVLFYLMTFIVLQRVLKILGFSSTGYE
jgi:hypothetical protein